MKKVKILKQLVPVIVFLGLLASLSSCNRGMGCPNNFSLDSDIECVLE